jgi:hypothetical protein
MLSRGYERVKRRLSSRRLLFTSMAYEMSVVETNSLNMRRAWHCTK